MVPPKSETQLRSIVSAARWCLLLSGSHPTSFKKVINGEARITSVDAGDLTSLARLRWEGWTEIAQAEFDHIFKRAITWHRQARVRC
jgi:hypothetical protein